MSAEVSLAGVLMENEIRYPVWHAKSHRCAESCVKWYRNRTHPFAENWYELAVATIRTKEESQLVLQTARLNAMLVRAVRAKAAY